MSRFSGTIGYAVVSEVSEGIFKEIFVEKPCKGDVQRQTRRLFDSSEINQNLTVNNVFSIVANPYASANIMAMRYLVWHGQKWKVTNVEAQRPRLILTVGGVYNG